MKWPKLVPVWSLISQLVAPSDIIAELPIWNLDLMTWKVLYRYMMNVNTETGFVMKLARGSVPSFPLISVSFCTVSLRASLFSRSALVVSLLAASRTRPGGRTTAPCFCVRLKLTLLCGLDEARVCGRNRGPRSSRAWFRWNVCERIGVRQARPEVAGRRRRTMFHVLESVLVGFGPDYAVWSRVHHL